MYAAGRGDERLFNFTILAIATIATIVAVVQNFDFVTSIFRRGKKPSRNGELTQQIEKLKASENPLKEDQHFIDAVLNTAPVIILILDANGGIVRFNRYMETLLGYVLEEVKGKSWFDVLLPEQTRNEMRNALFRHQMRYARGDRSFRSLIAMVNAAI